MKDNHKNFEEFDDFEEFEDFLENNILSNKNESIPSNKNLQDKNEKDIFQENVQENISTFENFEDINNQNMENLDEVDTIEVDTIQSKEIESSMEICSTNEMDDSDEIFDFPSEKKEIETFDSFEDFNFQDSEFESEPDTEIDLDTESETNLNAKASSETEEKFIAKYPTEVELIAELEREFMTKEKFVSDSLIKTEFASQIESEQKTDQETVQDAEQHQDDEQHLETMQHQEVEKKAMQDQETVKDDVQLQETVKNDVQLQETVKDDIQLQETVKDDIQLQETMKDDVQLQETMKDDIQLQETMKDDVQLQETVKDDVQYQETMKDDVQLQETMKDDVQLQETVKDDVQYQETMKDDVQLQETVKNDEHVLESSQEHEQEQGVKQEVEQLQDTKQHQDAKQEYEHVLESSQEGIQDQKIDEKVNQEYDLKNNHVLESEKNQENIDDFYHFNDFEFSKEPKTEEVKMLEENNMEEDSVLEQDLQSNQIDKNVEMSSDHTIHALEIAKNISNPLLDIKANKIEKTLCSPQEPENQKFLEVNMEQQETLAPFQWPGEKAVYHFYVWHCAETDERKENWTSGRFPFLAAQMPLPPKDKLDSAFTKKDWGMRRLEYKKNVPLYFYYAEPFQPSFYDPSRLNYLRTLYFTYFPAYFSKVPVPGREEVHEIYGPMLYPGKINAIPFLDESKDMMPCMEWLHMKLHALKSKDPLKNKVGANNLAGLVHLQEILRFYLRSYSFLLWSLNYFCNYDNHARLGFSSTGNKIYTNCFPMGRDILEYLCVRTSLPMQRLQNAQIDDVHIPYYRQETVPTFLGFGSFHGESWLSTSEKDCAEKEFCEKDFIVFDNCPMENKEDGTVASREIRTAENFRLFHKLWQEEIFASIDQLLAEHKIKIMVRRFSTDPNLPLSLADSNIKDTKIDPVKLYQATLELRPKDISKKTRYLRNFLSPELATEFYNIFQHDAIETPRNNIFIQEKPADWNFVAYLTYDGDLTTGNLEKKTLVDFFQPDALPVDNPREILPRGILPFVLRP
ncbi:MAG: hypothetical protein KBC30_02895 [Planctomycetes bacterium]|nr:hypothetical protein [Planctomycetota bacterium]